MTPIVSNPAPRLGGAVKRRRLTAQPYRHIREAMKERERVAQLVLKRQRRLTRNRPVLRINWSGVVGMAACAASALAVITFFALVLGWRP